jgi:hypothetical protein
MDRMGTANSKMLKFPFIDADPGKIVAPFSGEHLV